MKKKITLAIAALLVAALSLFVAACVPSGITFVVTAEYDSAQGTVTVTDTDGNVATTYNAGDEVVVTVTPEDGYVVDKFTVNGVETSLQNSVYQFMILSNTVVKATFKSADDDDDDNDKTPEELFAEAYTSVATTFRARGGYKYQITGESETTECSVITVFGENAVHIYETDAKTSEVYYDDVYVNVDGKVAMPYHTIDNKIEYRYSDNNENFADYGNPFKLLTADDFTVTETENVFALAAGEKADAAAMAITGYSEKIARFTVTIADGKITQIDIVTDTIERGTGDDKFSYVSTYTFEISQWGTATVNSDRVGPYSTKTEHEKLKTALETASRAKNYTVGVSEVSLTDFDLEYNTYVTETAIYIDCEGWENGFVQMNSGSNMVVYPFDYDIETELVTLYDASRFPTVQSMRSSFGGFAPEIFELDNEGAYVLREDCNTLENVRDILINFADGLDNIRLYASYSFGVRIKLNDDKLYQVELYYGVSDLFVIRTLTYSAFDETEMPITFDNCEKKSVLDDYIGTYTDGTVTVVVDKDGITINGDEYEITEYDVQYDLFTGEWKGGEWFITKQGEKQIILFNYDDDITYILTSTAIDPVEIPDEFDGVWSNNGKTVAIAYDKVEIDGVMLKVLSYDEQDGLYATDGEKTYRMFSETLKDGGEVLLVIVYVDGLSTAYYDLYKDEDASILPEVLVGTYEKFDSYYNMTVKAVVGLTFVSLEFDNDASEVSIVLVTDADGYWEITLDVDGAEYYLAEGSYSSDQIDIYSIEDHFSITLNRVSTGEEPPVIVPEVPETFYGTYSGEDDGVTYEVTISEEGLSIKIGNADAIEITEYEYDDGDISFKIDGVQYGVYNYEYDTELESLTIYSYEGLYTTLTRVGAEIPESFYGEYEGNDSWSHVTAHVVISADGITVVLNDGDVIDAVIESVGEENDGYGGKIWVIYFLIDGKEYAISEGYYTGTLNFGSVFDGYMTQITLIPVDDPDPSVEIPEKFYGMYMGSDDGTYYVVEIDSSGIVVAVNGNEVTAVVLEYGDYWGEYINITLDGVDYGILHLEEEDGTVTQIALACDDPELYVTLTRYDA